jgi:hypothetical protein
MVASIGPLEALIALLDRDPRRRGGRCVADDETGSPAGVVSAYSSPGTP